MSGSSRRDVRSGYAVHVIRGIAVAWLAAVACAAAPAPSPPAIARSGRVVEMGAFSLVLPPGAWRPTGDAALLTVEIPQGAGVDESGGGFALYDPRSDVFVRGFDGRTKGSETHDPGVLAAALHAGAERAFTASWTVTRREGADIAGERRRSYEAHDARGLAMRALVLTVVVDDGLLHAAGVQCVWKIAEPEKGELCREVLASLRRAGAAAAVTPDLRAPPLWWLE